MSNEYHGDPDYYTKDHSRDENGRFVKANRAPAPPAGEEVVLHRHGTLPDTDDDENYWCGWPSCAGIHEGEHATAIIVRGGKEEA